MTPYFPITDPTLIFLVVLVIVLLAPIIMGMLRIPHIIGMVLAGVVMGKYGLHILERDDSFELFGRVGLYYIMFLAGLEMDLAGLRRNLRQTLIFGLLSFLVPFVLTYFTSVLWLGYHSVSALFLACIMSACTLIAYPIVGRFGLQRNRVVTISVGASMIALLISLIVMTGLSNNTIPEAFTQWVPDSGVAVWVFFVLKFVAYCFLTAFILRRLTRWFFHRYSDAVMQFIFVLVMLFFSAAMSNIAGIEGIFGAFYAGLLLNRFIPHVSPLMSRLEFTGNAIFIPYFLIGVGMLINVHLLVEGGNILWVVAIMVVFGTLGKALAAYASCLAFRMPWSSGHMMFGLTSAHAAGAIAMAMVGMSTMLSDGSHAISDVDLNGVVVMILFTCIISTMVTERASRQIVLQEKLYNPQETVQGDDEKILIPVKYPETCSTLTSLAMLMRNASLNRGLIALNVVYDDDDAVKGQRDGKVILQQVERTAAAAGVPIQTQVRLATNIANGIRHAFKEYDASEIIIGMHIHHEVTARFWGEFAQSLFNGLNRQIVFARCLHPLNTLHRIQVAVPSRAEFEPGFYRWLERLRRLAVNLDSRIVFHGRQDTIALIREFMSMHQAAPRAEYVDMEHWNHLPQLAEDVADDDLFVVVTARTGTVSYKRAMDRLPDELTSYFHGKNLLIIFPDQYGKSELMTFTTAQHTEQLSAYAMLKNLFNRV